jgi:iron complex outermembrane receptor protein
MNSGIIVGAGVIILSAGVAQAQQADSVAGGGAATLQEIIVTAEKRSTNLQQTPISITALSGDTLAQNQVRQLDDIQTLVPNFKMGEAQGIAQVTIRGIGSASFLPGTEGAAAVNLNDVYVSRNVAQQSTLFDVSGIEVLRGPQGTLFGRNATAGAVDITTALPTSDLSGYTRVTAGNYGEVRLEAAIGGPIIDDKLLVRVAVLRETNNGYGTNIVTGSDIDNKDAYAIRGTVIYQPTENFKATLFAEYYDESDHGAGFHYFGAAGLSGLPGASGAPPTFLLDGGYSSPNVRDVASGINPEFELRTWAYTAILQWSNGGPFSLKSITGYRGQAANAVYDLDGGYPLNVYYVQGEPAHQISQEVQAHYDTGSLHLTGGLYYFHEVDSADPAAVVASTGSWGPLLGVSFPTSYFIDALNLNGTILTNAGAAFTQGTYSLTDQFSLTAGVRYSVESKHLFNQYQFNAAEPYTGSDPLPPAVDVPQAKFYSTTPKFGAQYQLDPQTFVFASYSQGFKSGGFDMGIPDPKPYLPEKLTDYEVGVKTTALDNRLRANVSAFYYDYTNLQVQEVIGVSIQTSNAATAHDYGVEGELTYLVTPALEVDTSAAWTHARYVDYSGPDPARPLVNSVDFSGNALDNAPDYQATLAAQYTWDLPMGSFTARGQSQYSSRFYFAPNNLALLSQGAYVKGDLFGIYRPNSAWEVTAYVKNVGDTTTKTSALVASPLVGNPVLGSLAPPRLMGLELQYKF